MDDVGSAARYLERACDADPSHPKARAHRATVAYLRDDLERARTLAIEILADDPMAESTGFTLVMANVGLGRSDVLEGVPAALREHPELRCALVVVHRINDDPAWCAAAIELYESIDHHDIDSLSRIPVFFAEAVAQEAFVHGAIPGSTGAGHASAQARLARAAAILREHADQAVSNGSRRAESQVNNAVAALRALNREDDATALLDRAKQAGIDGDSIALQRAILALNKGDPDRALAWLPDPCVDPEHRIIKAQCELHDDPRFTLDTLSGLPVDTPDEHHNRIVLELRVRAYLALDDKLGARDTIIAIRTRAAAPGATLPDRTLDLMCRRTFGEGDITAALETLVDETRSETPLLARLELADEAMAHGRPELAAGLLRDVDGGVDGYPLRRRCDALFESEASRTLHELLEALPAETQAAPFYAEYRRVLAARFGVGDVVGLHRDALERHPNHAGLFRAYLGVAAVEGASEEAKARLASQSLTELEGDPSDRMICAWLAAQSGRAWEGLQAAYRTLLQHWDDDRVHGHYRLLMLDASIATIRDDKPDRAGPGTVVSIRQGEMVRTCRLEHVPESMFANEQYGPGSALGRELAGNAVGDSVVIPGNANPTPWKVVSVDGVHGDLFGRSMQRADMEDSRVTGMSKMAVNPDEPGWGEAFLDVNRALEARDTETDRLLREQRLPLEMIGAVRGVPALDLHDRLRHVGATYRGGTGQADLQAGIDTLRGRAPDGCVVDTFTLQIIHGLDAISVVESVCGPVSITRATLRDILERAERTRLDDDGNESLRLGTHDGQPFGIDVPAPLKQQQSASAASFLDWVRKHCRLIDTLPREDMPTWPRLPGDHPPFEQTAGPAIAASGHGQIFVSCDETARRLATGICRPVDTASLVSVLVTAAMNEVIDAERMRAYLLELALGGERPLLIEGEALCEQWLRDGCDVTPPLHDAIVVLLGPDAVDSKADRALAMLLGLAGQTGIAVKRGDALRDTIFGAVQSNDGVARLRRIVALASEHDEGLSDAYQSWSERRQGRLKPRSG